MFNSCARSAVVCIVVKNFCAKIGNIVLELSVLCSNWMYCAKIGYILLKFGIFKNLGISLTKDDFEEISHGNHVGVMNIPGNVTIRTDG